MIPALRGLGVPDEPTVGHRREGLSETAPDAPSGRHTGRVRLYELAEELYRLPPEDFVVARDERVRTLRRAGARELADEVRRLRRPAVAAWLVNLLAATQRPALEELLDVGARMRTASAAADPALRALTDERRRQVTALTRTAAELADRQVAAGVLAEVTATLEAATADPAVADAVRSGRLVQPLAYAGFGPLPEVATAVDGGKTPETTVPRRFRPRTSRTPGRSERGGRTAVEERAQAGREARELAGAADDAQRAYETATTQAERAATDVAQAEAVVREARDALAEARAQQRATHRAVREAAVRARRAHAAAEAARERLAALDRAPGAPVSPR